MKLTARYRRSIACLCAVAMVVLGLAAQTHGLSHAVQTLLTVQASAQGDLPADAQVDHGQACEQCLKFAVFSGAAPAHVAPLLLHGCGSAIEPCAFAPPWRAEVFTAYVSRAPPRLA